MSHPFFPARVPGSLLQALLSAEYRLYRATRQASCLASGTSRTVLKNQTQHLDSLLMRLAWQLGCWGETALVSFPAPAPGDADVTAGPSPAGACRLHHLRLLHAGLIRQVDFFIARTNRLGDEVLKCLLDDLLAGHVRAIAALRREGTIVPTA